jgi:quercetin dioxygenase-like cupin family protein
LPILCRPVGQVGAANYDGEAGALNLPMAPSVTLLPIRLLIDGVGMPRPQTQIASSAKGASAPGNVMRVLVQETLMITRRCMLVASSGLAAMVAAKPAASETPTAQPRNATMEITRNGSQPSRKGPTEYFTGSVRIDPLFQAPEPARVTSASVTFEPGARTAWHTHPLGQTLIITSGLGWVQRAGGPTEEVRPGDVVWFSPGEKHWHGATPTTAMTHIAIQESLNGKNVDWMEHVGDEQYRK